MTAEFRPIVGSAPVLAKVPVVKLLLSSILSSLAFAAATLVTAPPASATCSVTINLPAKVSINDSFQSARVPLARTCGADYASFDLYGRDGWETIFIYDGNSVDHWDVYDWLQTGHYATRDADAWDSNFNDLPTKGDDTTVKYASAVAITSARRSGATVHIAGVAKKYSPNANGFTKHSNARVWLQRRDAHGNWITVARRSSAANGTVSFATARRARTNWRLYLAQTSSVWDDRSRHVVR